LSRVITLAVEGATDVAVAKRLLLEVGLQPGPEYVKSGKTALDRSLAGYNSAARFSCWLALRDLDHDAGCAPELCRRLLLVPAAHMWLHVPVRAVEAWLLADAESLSESLAVARAVMPADPESVPDPKRALVDLARRSRRRYVREALVPSAGTTARVGPGYAAFVIEFATQRWRPANAATRSLSLASLRRFLRTVSDRGSGRS
jgi:hypothetical protein